jgi:NAD(P)-dependent dehydrogenase (short-subunit alcohol dehydrogenase family)
MSLEDRVAVITGATGGLGRVVARRLAEEGAHLALVSSDKGRLEALGQELSLPEERWLAYAADLTGSAGAQAAVGTALAKFGRIDILLHLVGGWTGGKTILQTPAEEMGLMLQQHLWTTFYVVQAFVPHLVANGWGRIMAVSSPAATRPTAKSAAYAAGKAAQEALLLTLARELAGSGVTANLLVVRAIDAQHRRDSERTAETANWTTPEEIASAIVYLCSDAAGIVNGARIPLYGAP